MCGQQVTTSVSNKSREETRTSIFIHQKGKKTDGEKRWEEAWDRGCSYQLKTGGKKTNLLRVGGTEDCVDMK